MRIFKTKSVARFAKSEKITDASLRETVERAERGLIDADLGGALSSNGWRGRARASAASIAW